MRCTDYHKWFTNRYVTHIRCTNIHNWVTNWWVGARMTTIGARMYVIQCTFYNKRFTNRCVTHIRCTNIRNWGTNWWVGTNVTIGALMYDMHCTGVHNWFTTGCVARLSEAVGLLHPCSGSSKSASSSQGNSGLRSHVFEGEQARCAQRRDPDTGNNVD